MAGIGCHLVQEAVEHLVDEAADVRLVGEVGHPLQAAHALADVLVGILERLERPARLDAEFGLELCLQVVLGHLLEPTIGVVDEDDLPGAEQALAEDEGPDDVVGDHPTRVPDDVRVAVCEPEHLEDVHAAVHTGHDGEVPRWPEGEVLIVVIPGIFPVLGQQFVGIRGEVVEHEPQCGSDSLDSMTEMPFALESGADSRSDIFTRLLKNRVIMLGTDVNDDIANQICAQLLYLEGEDPNADIWLYINSPGGSVTAGMAIYDTMQFVSCDVATVCMGLAASMGQFLLTAGHPGKRYTLPNARIMMHQPLAGLRGQASDIAIQAEQLTYTKRRLAELIAQHSGRTIQEIQADSERDRWFTAEQAKDYGLCDHVILKRGQIV